MKDLLVFRNDTEIYEIILAVGNQGLKWVKGSKTFVPGIGQATVSRIYIDYNDMVITDTARVIVEATPEDDPEQLIMLKSYNVDHVMITFDAQSQIVATFNDSSLEYASS
jgi:hypothetical protein